MVSRQGFLHGKSDTASAPPCSPATTSAIPAHTGQPSPAVARASAAAVGCCASSRLMMWAVKKGSRLLGRLSDLGAQTVAPSSIIAWLKSPGRSGSTSAAASSHDSLSLNGGCCAAAATARILDSTRSTLPSTTGTRWPKAMEAMAPAV